MWWPFQWLLIYVLGGLTFIPLAVVAVVGYVLTYGSVSIGDPDPAKLQKAALQEESEKDATVEAAKASTGLNGNGKPLSGWLTVRRQFGPSGSGGLVTASAIAPSNDAPGTTLDSSSSPSSETGAERDIKGDARSEYSVKSGSGTATPTSTISTTAPITYSARIAQTYRQMVEARQSKSAAAPKEYLFCVLKGSVLFLYEDEAQAECVAAIGVDKYDVGVEGSHGGRFDGKDAEMFAKRNAVVLRVLDTEGTGLPVLAKGMKADGAGSQVSETKDIEALPWFLFSKSNTKLEDWYIALLQASSSKSDTKKVFSTGDMQALVDTIDTEPDPIPMRWLNAVLARVFFGLYRTEALEQFIIDKIMKKLGKVPRPNFLGPIVVREVNVGTFPPIFSKPMLKDLTAEGTASFEVHMSYKARPAQPNSEVRITIATTATIPTGFKPYVVDLVLAVVLKSIEGNMVVQIKKPPSNRFWYGFTQMPKMDIEIQPIVSERKIQIGMILKAIEKQLKEVIAESVVMPNMDDIAFFDTSKLNTRGGIFSEAGKYVEAVTQDTDAAGVDAPTQPGAPISSELPPAGDLATGSVTDSSGVRQRRPTKSQTMNAGYKSTNDNDTSLHSTGMEPSLTGDLKRVDTAPAGVAIDHGTAKSTALNATRKWFAGNGRPPSISSLGGLVTTGAANETTDKPQIAAESVRSVGDEDRAVSDVASASAPALVAKPPSVHSHASDASTAHKVSPLASVKSLARSSSPSPSTATGASDSVSQSTLPGDQPTGTTAAALITSLRARDKAAIQSQVNTARDAVKKWGVNWAAKRRAGSNTAETLEKDEVKPVPLYRPIEDERDHQSGAGPSRSPDAPKTLKERLDAAAAAAAANATASPSGRIRSSSVISRDSTNSNTPSSRPTLTASPSGRLAAAAGTSPPKWTLSNSRPTVAATSQLTALGSSSAPTSTASSDGRRVIEKFEVKSVQQERRPSTSNPVYTQPAAARGMVVPRMPKRPGEVVGMGSTVTGGIERRVSEGQSDRDASRSSSPHAQPEVDHGTLVPPPTLPPRPSSPVTKPDPKPQAPGEEKGELLVPHVIEAPPQLPPRKVTPQPSPIKPHSVLLSESDMDASDTAGAILAPRPPARQTDNAANPADGLHVEHGSEAGVSASTYPGGAEQARRFLESRGSTGANAGDSVRSD